MAGSKEVMTLEKLLSDKDPKKAISQLKFEQGMALLNELVSKVEGGELDLESSILSYERGMTVLGHLKELLSGAEEKLKVIQKSAS